ncbi:hypothetical protein [Nonomuraea longicatena]|uniref:Uncharacterized protein n=1 Tax=Nonomuraea longicatena TaxID=83682 RepID=A0ABP3YZG2_9ACTN
MLRRALVLIFAALACAAALSAPAQAQAARTADVEVVMSPLSLGEYCAARVSPSSTVGFYNGWLGCYRWSTGGTGLVYNGSGSAPDACRWFLPSRAYLGHSQGVSQALSCRYAG